MTPPKGFTQPSGWTPSAKRGGIYLLIAGMLAAAPACGPSEGQDYEVVVTQTPTQGVVTTIEETAPDEFAIVSEETVPSVEGSRFIIKKLDGTVDTLTMEESRRLVTAADTTQTYNNAPRSSLGSVLWWGAGGYMLGRMMSGPVYPGVYRDDRSYSNGSVVAGTVNRSARSVSTRKPVPGGRTGFFGTSRSRSFSGS